ncbi:nitroreductase family protein [Treponema sp. TIM-1]|uniref:nitroreductase family protein n=1 Tax=Treponema sp. TIM-1 TaxID=2898417 RepID=UPI0039815576
MDFDKLTVHRYSVRKFKDLPVEKEKLDILLEAARIAPTASNRQPQRIFLVTQPEGLEKIDRCTSCRFGAPGVFLICYDRTQCWVRSFDGQDSGLVDASIVTTQIMYQAEDLGLGSTWVMYFDPAAVVKEFALPPAIVPAAMLVFGYPAEDAAPADRHYQRHPLEKILCRTL